VLPNLLIIGAPKAGTTSLHGYLEQHPDVSMSKPKELRYFLRSDWRAQQAWYESHFDPAKPVRGESTPLYAAWPHRADVPERAAELVPDAKLIYLVRDPIDRLVSHWRQRLANGHRDPFSAYMAALERPENPVVCASRYATQLGRWLRHYDTSQVLVVDQHDLKTRRDAVVRRVFEFAGVDPDVRIDLDSELNGAETKVTLHPVAKALRPAGRVIPRRVKAPFREVAWRAALRPVKGDATIDDQLRARLTAYFQPEVDGLRDLTGQSFDNWSL
jgi:sulfotransferase family protein